MSEISDYHSGSGLANNQQQVGGMATENEGQGGAQVGQVEWDGRWSHTGTTGQVADKGHMGTTGQAADEGHMGIMGWVTLTMDEGTVGHSNKQMEGVQVGNVV